MDIIFKEESASKIYDFEARWKDVPVVYVICDGRKNNDENI